MWRDSLRAFFETRGMDVPGPPSWEDLCYIAGRDPRLWGDEALRQELACSIIDSLRATGQSRVLEVGCAAGFLASLVAPKVGHFVGVDLAEAPLAVARRLQLANAAFQRAEGGALPFDDGAFDGAFCYDVFTNFPEFAAGKPLIREMLYVVRPGGRVLVGSIPDRAKAAAFASRVTAVVRELDEKVGPVRPRPPAEPAARPSFQFVAKLLKQFGVSADRAYGTALEQRPIIADPAIVCYDFFRDDFVALGRELNVPVFIEKIHASNPYVEFRFDAIFERPAHFKR